MQEERRQKNIPVIYDRRRNDQRGGKEQALSSTSESARQYTDDEWEFIKAIDTYKRDNLRMFPSWSEVLAVLKSLGYSKAQK